MLWTGFQSGWLVPSFLSCPGRNLKAMATKASIGCQLPIRRGLSEVEAALYLSLSASFFRRLVEQGMMPRPRLLGRRRIWDVEELDLAFRALPRRGRAGRHDSEHRTAGTTTHDPHQAQAHRPVPRSARQRAALLSPREGGAHSAPRHSRYARIHCRLQEANRGVQPTAERRQQRRLRGPSTALRALLLSRNFFGSGASTQRAYRRVMEMDPRERRSGTGWCGRCAASTLRR